MGPLELMYGWQAVLCAVACVGVTKLVKTVIDLSMGEEKRKGSKWINKVVLPVTPVMIGLVYAMLVPLRPEALIEYVGVNVEGRILQTVAYGAWGAACGQFSTMIHGKLKDFLRHNQPG